MIDNVLLGVFMAGALVGALLMLVLRHPMRVALALVGTMLSLAGVYAMLGAHAVAVFQILIYVGAVMVFMVYVIMLLDLRDTSLESRYSWMLVPGTVAGLALLVVLGGDLWQHLPKPTTTPTPIGVRPFSVAFLNDYWLQFELVSASSGKL